MFQPQQESQTDESSRDYIDFPHLEPGQFLPNGDLALNIYSTFLTRNHDYPPAKVHLHRATLNLGLIW